MGQKRKALAGSPPHPKRVQKETALDDDDPIYKEPHSDPEYESESDDQSIASDAPLETPATPISVSSTRYPSELKTHLCPFEYCTKAFNRPARLQEHLRSHSNERLFTCTHDSCDKTFLRASHLNHHIKSAHTGIRDYVCDRPGCGKSFVTGSRLRRHLAAHDGRDKFRCTEYPPCNEAFRKHTTLQKHVMTAHLHQKPFPCPHVDAATGQKCPMAFETAGHLRAHESRLHTEKRFSCTECSQHAESAGAFSASDNGNTGGPCAVTFPTYALLQAHIRSAHPPQCPNCLITCSTARELRRHLEVAHGDVSVEERKVFPCTVPGCERSFTKKGNLTVHIRTVHEGEKRFGCGETDLSTSKKVVGWDGFGCGKRYGTKLALEEHIRTAHLGFPNAKAARRQRLGTADENKNNGHSNNPSTIATLTGAGYAEETNRHIACFIDSCPHRFHRDYDLWVHMGSKHDCSEDQIRDLFLRRALLSANEDDGSGYNQQPGSYSAELLGIYGIEFDTTDRDPHEPYTMGDAVSTYNNAKDYASLPGQETIDMQGEDVNANIRRDNDDDDDMALIDPVLAYNLMEG